MLVEIRQMRIATAVIPVPLAGQARGINLFRLVASLLFVLFAPLLARAQDGTISETEFWTRLRQSEGLVEASSAEAVRALWDGVAEVRLADGTTQPVDVTWLTAGLDDPAQRATALERTRALLAYHDRQQAGDSANASDDALNDVLNDPRFQYADAPIPEPPSDSPAWPDLGGLLQALFLIGGIGLLVLALIAAMRHLRVQEQPVVLADERDDPTTFSGAVDRASEKATAQDYRSAIRYLYLSALLLLDEKGLLRYDATLTNREHLRQLTDRPQLRDHLQWIITVFEDVWYGYLPIDEQHYQQFQQRIQQLTEGV